MHSQSLRSDGLTNSSTPHNHIALCSSVIRRTKPYTNRLLQDLIAVSQLNVCSELPLPAEDNIQNITKQNEQGDPSTAPRLLSSWHR